MSMQTLSLRLESRLVARHHRPQLVDHVVRSAGLAQMHHNSAYLNRRYRLVARVLRVGGSRVQGLDLVQTWPSPNRPLTVLRARIPLRQSFLRVGRSEFLVPPSLVLSWEQPEAEVQYRHFGQCRHKVQILHLWPRLRL